jgi:hypothetical protein
MTAMRMLPAMVRTIYYALITIPANTPHWWKDTSATGSVGYYAVNIEQ